jgi:hypothetical protein
MTYLFSLLRANSPAKELNQVLCYYINNTSNNQTIRVINDTCCYFEHIVFSGERLLFEASPASYLEIKASLSHDTQLIKIECKSLSVHQ